MDDSRVVFGFLYSPNRNKSNKITVLIKETRMTQMRISTQGTQQSADTYIEITGPETVTMQKQTFPVRFFYTFKQLFRGSSRIVNVFSFVS